MGQDARVRYTKMVIRDTFVSLLEKKPVNKITVKEICALAEINRATFYKYYSDAFDLMDKIEDEILKELQETIQSSLHEGIRKTLVQILEKMQESGKLYVTLFSGNGDTRFPMKIFQMCYREIEADINRQFPELTSAQKAWLYIYVAQGSSGILHYWISSGMKQPPAEVGEFVETLIANTLKTYCKI